MKDGLTSDLVTLALNIANTKYDTLNGQYKALEQLTAKLVEAAQYATCEKCDHNRCQGLRDALKGLI
jgi:hypothetical protein